MKTLTILFVSALLSINLLAQVDEQQIAALEDRIKVKIEQFGESSLEARDAFRDLIFLLKDHSSETRKTAHEFYGKAVYEFYRKAYKANKFTPIALFSQRVAALKDSVIYLIFYMSMLNMMKCLQLQKNAWIFV